MVGPRALGPQTPVVDDDRARRRAPQSDRRGGDAIPTATAAPTAPDRASIEGDETARGIVRAVLAGDRDAFAVLVDRELPNVLRVCYRVLGSRDEAEDAAQEAFVSAFRELPAWRGDGPFGAWVARIALHAALRRRRRARPVTWIDPMSLERGDEALDGAGGRAVARYFVDASIGAAEATDPAHLAVAAEQGDALREALAELEEPYREAIALRYFGGLTVPEIAQACDRPEGTVKTHLHRGLLRLRARLDTTEATR